MEPLYSCSSCLLYLFSIVFVIFSAEAVSSPVRYEGESMVVEGESFQILCWLTVFDTMKWQKNGVTLYSNENTQMTLSEDKSGGGIIGKLIIRKARENDTGEYTCSSFGVPGHTVVVVVGANNLNGNFDFERYKIMDFKSPLVLVCNLTIKEDLNNFKITWLKNDKPIIFGEDSRYELPEPNRLVIPKTLTTDAGNYTCSFVSLKEPGELKLIFNVVYKPVVKLPPYMSVAEGERLTITCTVFSEPVPEVYWRIGNKTYQESEGRVQILDNVEKGIPNAVLQIAEAEMDDRNTYICGASNRLSRLFNVTESSTFVRVKDKFAALWPFLGICAEVVILCTIILIYEKKRNKTELDESDTDGSPEQKNTPDHTKESEIRQRK